MFVVEFKVKKTSKSGKYMFASKISAERELARLKRDKGLKVKLTEIDM